MKSVGASAAAGPGIEAVMVLQNESSSSRKTLTAFANHGKRGKIQAGLSPPRGVAYPAGDYG
jgi:hypothetical protein